MTRPRLLFVGRKYVQNVPYVELGVLDAIRWVGGGEREGDGWARGAGRGRYRVRKT